MVEQDTTKYKLTKLEKETIILWNEEEDTICIDTFDIKLINQLRRAKEKAPDLITLDQPDAYGGVSAKVSKKMFACQFKAPMSEEERAKRSELGKKQMNFKKAKIPANIRS